ncbi:mannosyl transferase [Hymenobacter amundsenii]|uniref:Mannosyl transferase n=1 Tax=Hymenobacter amundsenii TaxID=2006685 RepID=A0A246FHF7_9BACT|nr:glycosyltransferase [Hymenobacter amundsenii]OWP61948.1 mannosyl transferase [Hymenobacter amundsenii]
MHVVLFTHPNFLSHQSMPRFARMLAEGMQQRGHTVEIWTPQPHFMRLPAPGVARKWLSYLDQYLMFPLRVRRLLRTCPADSLFVFTDQALGPWVPLVAHRPHVVHCHDFLAQRSALGEVAENRTAWPGRQYLAYIRRGYAQARNFISVSEHTRQDLHRFLPTAPHFSGMVYNGLNQKFEVIEADAARASLGRQTGLNLGQGYLLHVGGNQWYKNRAGVLALYFAWRRISPFRQPLLLIGEAPSAALGQQRAASPYGAEVHFLPGLPDEVVRQAYAGASVLLFPSLAEGFGWPIAEAMAAGCPVITTGADPMREVGGTAAFYLPRLAADEPLESWAAAAAQQVAAVVELAGPARARVLAQGRENARRFDPTTALDRIEAIYQQLV